jgi:hypothetical protein
MAAIGGIRQSEPAMATCVRTQRPVQPRFVPSTVGEPPVGPPDCNVEDQIKWLIEGGRVWTVLPRVLKRNLLGAVGDYLREVASVKERLVEADVDRKVEPTVDVHVPSRMGTTFQSPAEFFPSRLRIEPTGNLASTPC